MRRASATVLLLVVAIATGCESDRSSNGTHPPGPTAHPSSIVTSSPGEHETVGPDTKGTAPYTLELRGSATAVRIVAAAADDHHLVRVASSGPAARVAVSGHLVSVGVPAGAGQVTVQLHRGHSWQLDLGAAATSAAAELRGLDLRGVTTTARLTSLDVSADNPHGVVRIVERGGVHTMRVHLPEGTTVRVELRTGADAVTLFGLPRRAIAPGTTLATPSVAANYYQVEAIGAVSSVTVD